MVNSVIFSEENLKAVVNATKDFAVLDNKNLVVASCIANVVEIFNVIVTDEDLEFIHECGKIVRFDARKDKEKSNAVELNYLCIETTNANETKELLNELLGIFDGLVIACY